MHHLQVSFKQRKEGAVGRQSWLPALVQLVEGLIQPTPIYRSSASYVVGPSLLEPVQLAV